MEKKTLVLDSRKETLHLLCYIVNENKAIVAYISY